MNPTREWIVSLVVRPACAVVIVALTLCLTTTTQASQVVSIDLTANGSAVYAGSATSPGGLVPLPGQVGDWNELDLGGQFAAVNTTVSAINLFNGNGDPTGIDFYLNTGNSPGFPDPRPLIAFNAGGADTLGNDVIVIEDNSTIGWRFEGLVPNKPYEIRFFGQISVTNLPASFTTFVGPGPVSASTSAAQNYADLLVWADGSGMITGYYQRFEMSGNSFSSLSAVQILIPEPGSMMALGLASAALLLRRRH